MRTFFVLICSLALVCVTRGTEEKHATKSRGHPAGGGTHVQHPQTPHHVPSSGGQPTGGAAHVEHAQAPQRPAAAGGHAQAGGTAIGPTASGRHPETAAPGAAASGATAAKAAAAAPPVPVYHYNFPTKSGLTGLDFTRPLTPEEQSTIARQIANGQTPGTQASPGVVPGPQNVGAGAAAARHAEIEDAKKRGAVSTDRATKLAAPLTQAKVNPFRPQHFNLPNKPDPAIKGVTFRGTGHIPGSETWIDPKYAAFRNYHHEWHNRGWWRHHCPRIVLITGGWYWWHAGYWYPAWGYDLDNSYYPYDGPIYAYNDLAPDQVVANVQAALQALGYYQGPINGLLDPATGAALANYQRDNGLNTTSAVDEPTLAALGMA